MEFLFFPLFLSRLLMRENFCFSTWDLSFDLCFPWLRNDPGRERGKESGIKAGTKSLFLFSVVLRPASVGHKVPCIIFLARPPFQAKSRAPTKRTPFLSLGALRHRRRGTVVARGTRCKASKMEGETASFSFTFVLHQRGEFITEGGGRRDNAARLLLFLKKGVKGKENGKSFFTARVKSHDKKGNRQLHAAAKTKGVLCFRSVRIFFKAIALDIFSVLNVKKTIIEVLSCRGTSMPYFLWKLGRYPLLCVVAWFGCFPLHQAQRSLL